MEDKKLKLNLENTQTQINTIASMFLQNGKTNEDYKKLLKYSNKMLYEIPLGYKIIEEKNMGEFYCLYQNKIPQYIAVFESQKGSYYNFMRSVIWNMAHYYKLRNNKNNLESHIKENLYNLAQVSSDTYAYEKIDDSQFLVTKVHYDRVCESTPEYNKFSEYPKLDSEKTLQLRRDFKFIVEAKQNKTLPKIDNIYFNNLYSKMNKKVTRRRILLYIMIFPDLVLDYYTKECSILFSVDEELIIELLSTSRLCFIKNTSKIEKEKDRSAKIMMRILELKEMRNYSNNYYKLDDIDKKIKKNTEYYNNALKKINELKNKHISQRTLGKILNIKAGTMASSITYSKKILKECYNTQQI